MPDESSKAETTSEQGRLVYIAEFKLLGWPLYITNDVWAN